MPWALLGKLRCWSVPGEKLDWSTSRDELPAPVMIVEGASEDIDALPWLAHCSEATDRRIAQVPGSNMCAPTALTCLDLASGAPSQMSLAHGPYTYRKSQEYYHLTFFAADFEELLCADIGGANGTESKPRQKEECTSEKSTTKR